MILNEINKSYENIPDTCGEQFEQIIENVKKWIQYVSEGYDEVIIQSSHYPFSNDSPVTIWIRKSHPKTPVMLYSMDWDLFNVRNYPEISYEGKDTGTNPFEYLRNYWDQDWDTADNINQLVDEEWDKSQYIIEDPDISDMGLTGSQSGNIKPHHEVTETTHMCVNDYDGDVYLDLYLIARRKQGEIENELQPK